MASWEEISPASFIRIIMPCFIHEKKLPLPIQFVRKYGGEISNFVRINIPVGIWRVGIERAGDMLWLSDNWQKLMQHHNIGSGHLLTFKYTGNSKFDVHIFDPTATEIDYPPITATSQRPAHVNEASATEKEEFCVGNDDSDVKILDSPAACPLLSSLKHNALSETPDLQVQGGLPAVSSTNRETDFMSPECEHGQIAGGLKLSSSYYSNGKAPSNGKKLILRHEEEAGSSSRNSEDFKSRLASAEERKRAFCAANMCEPDSPSFVVALKKYNVGRALILNVPRKFVRDHLCNFSKDFELEDSDGRKWPVRCIVCRGKTYCLSKGWAAFVRENKLDEGDICLFELIQTDKPILKVSVFRTKEEIQDRPVG